MSGLKYPFKEFPSCKQSSYNLNTYTRFSRVSAGPLPSKCIIFSREILKRAQRFWLREQNKVSTQTVGKATPRAALTFHK